MLRFEKLNKLIGIRRASDFLKPRTINDTEFMLPVNSAIIEYDNEYVGDALYERTPRKTYVYVEDKYIIETQGKYKRLSITKSSIIAKLKQEDLIKEFKFVLNKEALWKVPNNTPILIDAYRVKDLYEYRSTKSSALDEHNNRLKNAIAHTVDPDKITNRQIYIPINIPKEIPKLRDIKKMNNMKGYKALNKYGETNIMTILEIVRAISGEESMFDVVKDKNNADLVLLFTIHGKISMVKYNTLLSLNNELNITNGIKGYSPKKAIKVFLKYILLISLSGPKTLIELENDNKIIDNVSTLEEDEKSDDDTIEELIDRHNELNNTREEVILEKPTVSLEEVLEHKESREEKLNRALEERVAAGTISEKVAIKISAIEVEEVSVQLEDLKMEIKTYPDSPTVLDKGMLSASNNEFDKQYIKNIYPKHQKEVILAGGGSHVIHAHNIKTSEDITNSFENHEFKVTMPNGRTITRKIIIPKIDEEGYMKVNGNRYRFRKQKGDNPIKKISPTQVALSSYYSKIFVRKAEMNSNNESSSILTQLKARSNEDIFMLLVAKIEIISENVPHMYSTIARKIKSFKIDGIYCLFDYENRKTLGEDKDGVIFATGKSMTYYVNKKNIVSDQDGKQYGTLYEWLRIDESNLKFDYANIYILGTRIPLVLVLSYYYGLSGLLSLTKTKIRVKDKEYVFTNNDVEIKFKNGTYIISGSIYTSVLFGALSGMKELREIDFQSLDYSNGILDLFSLLKYTSKLPRELENLDTMWVDPITKDVLEQLDEPTTWRGLLVESARLLITNHTKNQNDMRGIRIKGYERLNGIVYNIIAKSIRDNEHRVGNVSSKFELNPYAVLAALSDESTFVPEDDLNPIATIKTKEDVTLTGMFGRSKEAISVKDRVYHESNLGVLSESTKDNRDVGVTTFLSASSTLDNLMGIGKKEIGVDISNMTASNIFSTSTILAPGALHDDGKRLMAINTQNSHKIPTKNSVVLPIRTGYESVIPYKMNKKFIAYAEEKGKVVKITNKLVEIKYTKKSEKYKLHKWTSKEINNSTFTHNLVTSLKVGDTVDMYDIIYYDITFFEVDMFNRKRVLYKNGEMTRIAFDESQESHEDSGTVTKAFAKEYTTNITSIRNIIIDKNSIIYDIKDIGSNVSYNDILFTSINNNIEDDAVELSEKAKEVIADMLNSSPKAKKRGKITKIVALYNCDLEDMSESVHELVKSSDISLKKEEGFTGRVDNTYSIKGKPLLNGEIELKFYIEKEQSMQIGDKAVLGNQLKFVVGKIADGITDENGEAVDGKFGYAGLGARIVNSPLIIGTTALVLSELDRRIVDLYFNT